MKIYLIKCKTCDWKIDTIIDDINKIEQVEKLQIKASEHVFKTRHEITHGEKTVMRINYK